MRTKVTPTATLSEFFAIYLENHLKMESEYWEEYKRHFELYLPDFHQRDMSDIKRMEVIQLKAKLGKRSKSAANKALTLISMLYNKAIDWEVFDGKNPASRVPKYPKQSRDRYLTIDEIPRFLASVGQLRHDTARDFILMLLFTGQRFTNVAEIEWGWIDSDQRVLKIPKTKNGTSHVVPLIDEALIILNRRKLDKKHERWVFPLEDGSGPIQWIANTWRIVINRANIKDLTPHDLRRTHATYAASSGESLAIIGRILNHKHVTSTQIYAKVQLSPVRLAMERSVAAMLDQPPGKPGGATFTSEAEMPYRSITTDEQALIETKILARVSKRPCSKSMLSNLYREFAGLRGAGLQRILVEMLNKKLIHVVIVESSSCPHYSCNPEALELYA